jgi:enoyl-[acyl-carrier protein] reductase I
MLTGRTTLPRRIAVFGVASGESIAWHIAQGLQRAGCSVHIGHQQRFLSRVLRLVKEANPPPDGVHRCDLTVPAELEATIAAIGPPLDGIVHSVAFAPPSTFNKQIDDIDALEFTQTLLASTHSLLSLARAARGILTPEASIVAMTYVGAQRVIPGYRLMGIAKAALESSVRELAAELGPLGVRVNAISAGPIRTLAASAIPQFEGMLEQYRNVVPLRRSVEAADVADCASFLLSPASRCITGQTIYVDAGFSILGLAGSFASQQTTS